MTRAAHICPVCRAPHAPELTICPNCGLIFSSAPLPDLQTDLSAALQPALLEPPTSLAPKSPLQPGQQLMDGRYTVQRLLASGGMGAVALATDHSAFERAVVVKMMLDYFDPAKPHEAEEARARFIQEARTLATLHHPSIPQIYAFVQDGPRSYLVMEYVKGDTLEQSLTQRDSRGHTLQIGQPYPLEQVLGWGVDLCRLLEYLRDQSSAPVVHQDIKPANLLLDRNSGAVRLVDFGTAQVVGKRTGAGYGTPGYAPPEQYKGQSESRSDVYALAATLYHLLTDDDPRDHPFQFPRLQHLGDVGALLEHALSPDVDERPSASELRAKLNVLLEEQRLGLIRAPDGTVLTSPEALVAWCERHWNAAAAWMCADLPERIERRWNRQNLAQELRGITQRQAHNQSAALDAALALLDPHGFGQAPVSLEVRPKQLYFGSLPHKVNVTETLTVRNSGRRHVMLRLVSPSWILLAGATNITPLAPGEQAQILLSAFVDTETPKPDQTINGYQNHQLVLQVPVHGEFESKLPKRSELLKLMKVLFFGAVVLYLLLPGPAPQPRSVSTRQTAIAQVLAPTPSLGPRATRPTAPATRGQPNIIPTVSLEQPRPSAAQAVATFTPAEVNWAYVSNADISPDGQLLAHVRGNTLELLRARDRQTLWRFQANSPFIYWVGFSPDGSRIAVCAPNGSINILQTSTGRALLNIGTNSSPNYLAWSPDGKRLVERTFDGQVRVWDTAAPRSLWSTQLPVFPTQVVWGADGKTVSLAFADRVEVLSAESGKQVQLINLGTDPIQKLALSPDGRFVALETRRAIQVRSLSGNTLVQEIGKDDLSINTLAFSNDGRLLAGAGYRKVFFWTVGKDTKISVSTALDFRTIRFSADGQKLIGVSQIDNSVELVDVVAPK